MIQVSRAEVCAIACAELFRDAGEIMVSPMTTMASIGARLARLDVRPGHPADRRRGPAARRHPGDRRGGRGRGLDAVRPGLRDTRMGPAPRRDGRQPGRPLRQPEPLGVRAAAAPDPADVRRSRRPGQHDQPRHQLLGRQPLHAGVLRSVDIVSGIGWDKVDADNPAYRFVDVYRVVVQPGSVRLRRTRTTPCGRCRCTPGCRARRGAGEHLLRDHGLDDADGTRLPTGEELRVDPRRHRPESHCATREIRV